MKSRAVKTLCYKAGAVLVEYLTVYLITGQYSLSAKIVFLVTLVGAVYYYLFECAWARRER